MPTSAPATRLECLRTEMRLPPGRPHSPAWRVERANERFTWLFDGDRAVGLIDEKEGNFELRCHGPQSTCPPAVVPKHYHAVSYVGVRIILDWWACGRGDSRYRRTGATLTTGATAEHAWFRREVRWNDGACGTLSARLRYDAAWGAYVLDVDSALVASRLGPDVEYCNVLPAGIGDSRPGRERLPWTFWQHPDGLRRLGKNPLWWNSVGAQEHTGRRRIVDGGFLGFGPDPDLNPVVEIVRSEPATGAGTCDNLQDEHLHVVNVTNAQAEATGWFHVAAVYRLFSIPETMAAEIVRRAADLDYGPMLAWKFHVLPMPPLPADLTRLELPKSPFFGASDWSTPLSWDEPYNGRIWKISPDPTAPIRYDRTVGRTKPGSICLRPAAGETLSITPSGHTLYTDGGVRYRGSVWIRTEGAVHAWLETPEVLFSRGGDRPNHVSPEVGPNAGWTQVRVEFTAQGDEAPFADTVLCARGDGQAWFSDLCFEPLP